MGPGADVRGGEALEDLPAEKGLMEGGFLPQRLEALADFRRIDLADGGGKRALEEGVVGIPGSEPGDVFPQRLVAREFVGPLGRCAAQGENRLGGQAGLEALAFGNRGRRGFHRRGGCRNHRRGHRNRRSGRFRDGRGCGSRWRKGFDDRCDRRLRNDLGYRRRDFLRGPGTAEPHGAAETRRGEDEHRQSRTGGVDAMGSPGRGLRRGGLALRGRSSA